MRNGLPLFKTLSALSMFCASAALAETPGVSRSDKAAIIASLDSTLTANYAFPDIARKIAPVLQEHLKNGDYDCGDHEGRSSRPS